MNKIIDHLALAVVIEEIENVWESDFTSSYKEAFDTPEFREKLITYVLRKNPAIYTIVDPSKQPHKKHRVPYKSLELRLHLENSIHQAIQYILLENI